MLDSRNKKISKTQFLLKRNYNVVKQVDSQTVIMQHDKVLVIEVSIKYLVPGRTGGDT